MRIKRSILLMLCSVFIFFYGCTRQITSISDEVKSYSWQAQTESGTLITLEFGTNYADISFKGKDSESTADINGACVMSDSGFVITDTQMGEIIYFDYKLDGEKLRVVYNNAEIVFEKKLL